MTNNDLNALMNDCMTVGELREALQGLPDEAILVRHAGGDCDGYVALSKSYDEIKEVGMGVRADWDTNEYHGPFEPENHTEYEWLGDSDEVESFEDSYRKIPTEFVLKFKGVSLGKIYD